MNAKKHIILYFSVAIVSLSSCRKDFEELNKDPNGFTEASNGSLFNAVVRSMMQEWSEQLYVNNSVLVRETQQASLPYVRWTNYSIGTEDIWSNYYKALPNLRELERRFNELDTTSGAVKNMMAMVKTLKAFKTFKVTDLFGDIPYSGAGYGFQSANALNPAFDSQRNIYLSLLNDLQWSASNISPSDTTTEAFRSFKEFDKLFDGDLKKWQKFANSLSLRYAMRMVNKEPLIAGNIIKDIIENAKPTFGVNEFGQLILLQSESAMLTPIKLGFRNESKGWSFNQSEHLRLGTTMWQQMSANDSADGSGIYDPRAYYFFETNNNNKWYAYPNDPVSGTPDGGAPYDYQRDVFYVLKGAGCLYSPVNYFMVRDMDFVPDVFITGAEVLFLRAEAYQRGIGVNKDLGLASTAFLDGIQFSLNFWETTMKNSKLPLGATFTSNINVPASLNFFTLQNNLDYFSASEQDQLKEIYEQCWIDMIRQPQEAFSLMRRTGGLTPRQGAQSTVNKFPIPPTEVSYNFNNYLNAYNSSNDNLSSKVWWMN